MDHSSFVLLGVAEEAMMAIGPFSTEEKARSHEPLMPEELTRFIILPLITPMETPYEQE